MSGTDRVPMPQGEPTTPYEGTAAFRPAPRLPSDTGPATEPTAELQALLRQRLKTAAVISLCAAVVATAILTPGLIHHRNWKYVACFCLLVAAAAAFLLVLRNRRVITLRGLRAIELAALGILASVLTWNSCNFLFVEREAALFARLADARVGVPLRPLLSGPQAPPITIGALGDDLMLAFGGGQSLNWVLLLVGYGVFIPNTWKRATVVLSVVALIPIVLHGSICLLDPDISSYNAILLMVPTGLIAFVAAMLIFGASRIDSLRREVLAARRLGQYQLKERLGAGGMGEVYRAEHVLLQRPCAIKLIRPERAGDPTNLARFEREVQATATLTNWHTVEIYDYGHAADGTFYYVMEYLPGLTLDELVGRHGPLPPERAVHLLRQMCVALREAHAIGLIHRDIKPGNIIVGQRGGLPDVAKLLDFGLVRAPNRDGDGEKLTQTGVLVGTPAYMSPEQAGGDESLDARSDIYSLGAVAYFLLTGRPPFTGKSAVHVVAAHLHERVKPLVEVNADLPAELNALVLRCLEKEPQQRFQSAEELEEALGCCACADRWDRRQAVAWWNGKNRKEKMSDPESVSG